MLFEQYIEYVLCHNYKISTLRPDNLWKFLQKLRGAKLLGHHQLRKHKGNEPRLNFDRHCPSDWSVQNTYNYLSPHTEKSI